MATPFLGEIKMFGGNFAPRNFAFCSGQTIAISQNTALFSILGTTYGGNGISTFQLPDFQGRVPMHQGNGAGLTPRVLGEKAGSENVTLLATQMPQHNHAAVTNASSNTANDTLPNNNFLASGNQFVNTNNATMNANAVTIGQAGGSQPHTNIQPYLVVSFIIGTSGIFPSRN